MRIVAGRHRGRRLRAPAGEAVRPTSDRARQAIFDILAHGAPGLDLAGAAVLDVFAGSGALGLEALSRGAGHATFVDSDPAARAGVRQNAAGLGESANVTLLGFDAARPPPPGAAERPANLVFLDPPYGSGLAAPALEALAARGWIAEGAICVVEAGTRESLAAPAGFAVIEERTYGQARVSFLRYRPRTGGAAP